MAQHSAYNLFSGVPEEYSGGYRKTLPPRDPPRGGDLVFPDRPAGGYDSGGFFERRPDSSGYQVASELPRRSGYDEPPRRSGYPEPPRHSGYDEPPRRSGYDDLPRRPGYDNPPRRPAYDEPLRRSGYDEPSRRSAYLEPPRHSGYQDPSRGSSYNDYNNGPPRDSYRDNNYAPRRDLGPGDSRMPYQNWPELQEDVWAEDDGGYMEEQQPKKKKKVNKVQPREFFCKYCQVSCNGHQPMQMHLKGKAHLKNMEAEYPDEKFCKVCRQEFVGTLELHEKSRSHRRAMRTCDICCQIFETVPEYKEHVAKHKDTQEKPNYSSIEVLTAPEQQDPVAELGQEPQQVELVEPVSGFFCRLCMVFFRGDFVTKLAHCSSAMHLRRCTQASSFPSSQNTCPPEQSEEMKDEEPQQQQKEEAAAENKKEDGGTQDTTGENKE